MSRISIVDLEVFYRVGVPDEERAKPQRLLLTIDMDFNYQAVTDDLLKFGDGRSWKLIEKLAADVADLVLKTYHPQSVQVEVKKFVIPQARYVAVALKSL